MLLFIKECEHWYCSFVLVFCQRLECRGCAENTVSVCACVCVIDLHLCVCVCICVSPYLQDTINTAAPNHTSRFSTANASQSHTAQVTSSFTVTSLSRYNISSPTPACAPNPPQQIHTRKHTLQKQYGSGPW